LRVITADECVKNNVAAFTYNIKTGFLMLGKYTSRETAKGQIDVIRKLCMSEDAGVLL
jgi:hypothetical protein